MEHDAGYPPSGGIDGRELRGIIAPLFYYGGIFMDHFPGIVPDERYKNEILETQRAILAELKAIREQLVNDSKVVKVSPVITETHVKRQYNKRGAK